MGGSKDRPREGSPWHPWAPFHSSPRAGREGFEPSTNGLEPFMFPITPATQAFLAEGLGFEPRVPLAEDTRFPGEPIRPLSHPSKNPPWPLHRLAGEAYCSLLVAIDLGVTRVYAEVERVERSSHFQATGVQSRVLTIRITSRDWRRALELNQQSSVGCP